MKPLITATATGEGQLGSAAEAGWAAGLCYLVHAGLVQSHDGGVSQPVVHGAQCFLGIQILGFEQLLHEFFVEHGADDVVHNCKDKEALWFAPEQRSWSIPAARFTPGLPVQSRNRAQQDRGNSTSGSSTASVPPGLIQETSLRAQMPPELKAAAPVSPWG